MSRSTETKRCRNCLGDGCIHCGGKGGVSARVFHRDVEGDRLRALVFDRCGDPVQARANENRQTLARMKLA